MTIDFNDGRWHQIVVTRNASDVKFYLDGAYLGTQTFSQSWHELSLASFGAEPAGGYRWDGDLGYGAVYSDALTAAEITQNCNALESRFTADDDICP